MSDISPGMVAAAQANGRRLGFEVEGRVGDAEHLPYDDGSFDLVVGHAVIHHIPDVELALRECLRVLRPGGRLVIAGEPTTDRRLVRAAARPADLGGDDPGDPAAVAARALGPGRRRSSTSPRGRRRWRPWWTCTRSTRRSSTRMALRAGGVDVRTQTEELTAAFLGWPVRTFEAAVNPERLGWGWSMFAYRSWLRLSAVDRLLTRAHVVPARFFYNVALTATKP